MIVVGAAAGAVLLLGAAYVYRTPKAKETIRSYTRRREPPTFTAHTIPSSPDPSPSQSKSHVPPGYPPSGYDSSYADAAKPPVQAQWSRGESKV